MSDLFEIIYEDGKLLVINKPAGLVCHPTKRGEHSSLIGRARLHLGAGSQPRLVNRLDPNGIGTLFLADLASEGTASLLGWGLEIQTIPEPGTMVVFGLGLAVHNFEDALQQRVLTPWAATLSLGQTETRPYPIAAGEFEYGDVGRKQP